MSKNKLIPMVLIQILLMGSLYAQQSVVSAGNEICTSSYSMSNSTGMPDFACYQNDHGSIQFGVLQPTPSVPISDYSVLLVILLILTTVCYRYYHQFNLKIKNNQL